MGAAIFQYYPTCIRKMQVPVRTNNICMICIIRLKWTPTLQLKFLSDMTFIQKDLKLSVLFLCFYSWLDYTYIYDFFREFFFAAIYKTKIVIFVHYGFSWWLAISLLFSSVHKYKYKYSHAPLADPGGGVSGFGTSPPFSKTSVCRWLGRGGVYIIMLICRFFLIYTLNITSLLLALI